MKSETSRVLSEAKPLEKADSGKHWYIVHTYSGYENKVEANLKQRINSLNAQDDIFEVIVPTEEEIEVREGKRRTIKKKIFPGYVLVHMKLNDKSWNVVRNTPGVTGFVSSQDSQGKLSPVALEEKEVSSILNRMQAEAPKVKVGFTKGESVRITDGPFVDFIGIVDEINLAKGRVKVLVSFLGRETPVELDFLQVERL